jgi:hypothetical protein
MLALLGASAIRADEVAQQQQERDQQQRLARLADAAIATALEGVTANVTAEAKAPFTGSTALNDETLFVVDENQVVLFPAARVFVAPPGAAAPTEAAVAMTPETRELVMQAQSAAAQGFTDAARAAYQQLRTSSELADWAGLQLSLLDSDATDAEGPRRKSMVPSLVPSGLSPSGIPVAILAGALVEQSEGPSRRQFGPYLQRTLEELRHGRWWLELQQRRFYDAQLRTWIAEANGSDTTMIGEDPVLQTLPTLASHIAQAIESGQQFRSRAYATGSGSDKTLLVWVLPGAASRSQSGVALSPSGLARVLTSALAPLRSPAVPMTLADGDRRFWGDAPDAPGADSALASVAGWTLTLSNRPDADATRRERNRHLLNYTLIVVPVFVLACGLVMTVSIVRRELTLSRLRAGFLAAVTHEFKSPITGIRLLMERIASGHVPDQAARKRYDEAISAEVDRLDGLVNRLLEAHRLEIGRRNYVFRETAIETVTSRALAQM